MPRVKKSETAPEVDAEQVATKTKRATKAKTADPPEIDHVSVRIPVGPLVGSEFRLHIDVDLRAGKASTVRRITEALDRQQATLSNGQRVSNNNATIRWILEQVEAALSIS